MEISFAYFAPPGKEKLQGENISLIIKFFLGMHDLFHLPIPIWIAVESIVGTVRLRCQLVSQSPFIRVSVLHPLALNVQRPTLFLAPSRM